MVRDIVWSLLSLIPVLAGVLPLLLAAVAIARIAGSRIPRGVIPAIFLVSGLEFGYVLLALDRDDGIRAIMLVCLAVVVGGALLIGRVDGAGLALVGAGGPTLLYGAAWVFDAFTSGRTGNVGVVVPPIVTAAVGVAIGTWLIDMNRRLVARLPPPAPPPLRPWNAISRALVGPSVLGLSIPAAVSTIALIGAVQVTVVLAHGRPILETIAIVTVGIAASAGVAVLVWAVAWPPRSRRAYEAFAWLGEREMDRFRQLTGESVPTSMAAIRRYLRRTREQPETRWLRAELIAISGDLETARATAERIVDDTPIARLERAAVIAYIDWLSGGPDDLFALEAAAAALDPVQVEKRAEAEVMVAICRSRVRIANGDADPIEPLRIARDRLGRLADGVLVSAARRRLLPGYLRITGVFVVLLVVADRASSI